MQYKKLLFQAFFFFKFIFHAIVNANSLVTPQSVQTYQFFYGSADFTQQIYTQTNFQILREYVYSSLTNYTQITTKQCGNYLHFLMSDSLLDLQFVKLNMNLPNHQWIQVQLNFYKTGQWGTEDFSVIVDQAENTYQYQNDQSITCQDWQNYTLQQVSYQTSHTSNSLTIVVKSKANIDIRKWSIGQIQIQAFICPSNSYFDQSLQCFSCIEGCKSCFNSNYCDQCQDGYYLQSTNHSCVKNCNDNQYLDSSKICQNCPSGCSTCNQLICISCQDVDKDPSQNCQVCNKDLKLTSSNTCASCSIPNCLQYDTNSIKCSCKLYSPQYMCQVTQINNCSQQNYIDGQCICQVCKSDTFMYNGQCRQTCPQGYGQNRQTMTCDRCQISGCQYCSQNYQQCQVCSSGYLYYQDTNKCQYQQSCSDSYYLSNNQCIKCQSSCQTCDRYDTCTQCQQGLIQMSYYLPNLKIPQQYSCFDDTKTEFLQVCSQKLTVFYPDQRVTPIYYEIQSQKTCATQCPGGYGYNSIYQTCNQCIDKCQSCQSNWKICDYCQSNYYIYNNNNNVYQCVDNCINGYYIYQLWCVQNCPVGYGSNLYPNGKNECLQCTDTNCQTCDSQQVCTQCFDPKKLLDKSTNQCVDSCPSNYFYQYSSQRCIKCSSNCSECDKLENNCTSCPRGLQLFYDQTNNAAACVETCPSQYYGFQGQCKSCPQNCQICDSNGVCQQCQKSFMIYNQNCVSCPNQDILIDNQCQYCKDKLLRIEDGTCIVNQDCGVGYFIENGICKQCGLQNENCSSINSQEEINKCSQYQNGQGKCQQCSAVATYFNQGWCLPCPEGCSSCNQQGQCFQCSSDDYCYIQSLQICRKITTDLSCKDMNQQKCTQINDQNHGYCLKCSDVSLNQCVVCDTNSFLFNSECLLKCPTSYFGDRNIYEQKYIYSGVCRPFCLKSYIHDSSEYCFYCPSSCDCQLLTDSTKISQLNQNYQCTQCNSGYYKIYISSTYSDIFNCVENCPINYYLDSDKKQCIKCSQGCLTCTNGSTCTECGAGTCTVCSAGYFFQPLNNTCVFDCEPGQYKDNQLKKCVNCGNNCLQCYSQTYCYQCDSKSYRSGNDCVTKCNQGEYPDNTNGLQCKPCVISNCKSCVSQSTCEVCNDSTYLQDQGQKCVSQCSDGYSKVLISGVYKCIKDCGQSQYLPINSEVCTPCPTGCLQCNNQGFCSQCKQGFKYDSVNSICQQCSDIHCLNCDINAQQCQSCQFGYFYNKDIRKCITQCQNGYYYDIANSSCIQCPKNCKSCVNKDICSSCEKGFFIDQNNQCSQCSDSCSSCSNSSENCQSCKSDYQLINNKCVIQCDLSCLKCSGSGISQCLSCNSSRFLYLGRCICKEGFVENGSPYCQQDTTSNEGIKSLQNSMAGMSAALITTGIPFPTGIKCLEISSMVSYLTYSNAKYEGKVDQYLQILYNDNISPLIPNYILSIFPTIDQNHQQNSTQRYQDKRNRVLEQMVDVNEQYQSDYRFMKNSKTINYLINIAPLLTIYAIFGFVLLVKHILFRFTNLSQSTSKIVTFIKFNLRHTIFLLIFYLSYQELLLITLLQISSMFQGGALNIISSLISIISIIVIVFMIYLITKIILFTSYITFKEKSEKYGPLFYGLKESKLAHIFLLVRIVQKTLICIITVYGGNSNLCLSFLIITSVALVYEIAVRPFKAIITAIVSITLNGLYFLIVLFAYMIEKNQDDSTIKSQYSSHLEKALLAFIILKNSAILIEFILFIIIIIRRFRSKTGVLNDSKESSNRSFDLESSLQKEIQWRDNALKQKQQISKMKTRNIQNENSFDTNTSNNIGQSDQL
ncbi:hypothetical protein TTHERM_00037250 (macronuclear) [Tetrahymena thermophila SB210]|uniref:TNFR-Cys domain-containing protein n=1 Tax=Tetrahymena thermophila (strain SB210) TaxID=312017 RepID=Q22M94_TETTS|nr:hypothetical protein TTHERM_00037250 [Tetrahymena thermophila SB210]EAR86548.3 hypothetical protein TTHERM_00037250 [Tetrahymena thermophila SB210]|eukprot:XP_977126.3 hypothetical protein TTHERM_00037250 [Tetrahymena thermophila SB210]